MMTSETGKRKNSRPDPCRAGFTLLEICICLCIAAILIGAAVPSVDGWLKEQKIRNPARYLSLLARTARLAAIEHQRPYQIDLQGDRFWMEPASPPTLTTTDSSSPQPLIPANDEVLPTPYLVQDSTVILIQPWNEDRMRPPGTSLWTFSPNGLCDPIAVKFIQGSTELELDFDPLTATVSKEKFYRP
jgi:prepilin-type N-terminal cleavage/methylation domain-containing protein